MARGEELSVTGRGPGKSKTQQTENLIFGMLIGLHVWGVLTEFYGIYMKNL